MTLLLGGDGTGFRRVQGEERRAASTRVDDLDRSTWVLTLRVQSQDVSCVAE